MNQVTTVTEKAPVALSQSDVTKGIRLTDIESAYRFANIIYTSGMAPKSLIDKKTEKEQIASICAVIFKGLELGLPPMQSLQGIAYINGTLTVWGDTALGLVKSSKKMKALKETPIKDKDGKTIGYKCFGEAVDGTTSEHEFLLVDAPKDKINAQYANPWKNTPIRMCQMRARSFVLRDLWPDVLTGIGIAEEVSDYEGPQIQEYINSLSDIQPPTPVIKHEAEAVITNQSKQTTPADEFFKNPNTDNSSNNGE